MAPRTANSPPTPVRQDLEARAKSPDFRAQVARLFPAGAAALSDERTRRDFLRLMGASLLLAGLGPVGSGCRRPEETIRPFSTKPEEYVPGVPHYFATAMPAGRAAVPLLVRSNDGRPTKIEGNPDAPDNNGGTDCFAQASILELYDPDRAQRYVHAGRTIIKEAALDFLGNLAARYTTTQGMGLCFLAEPSSSPSRARVQREVSRRLPKARWFTHEAVDGSTAQRTATLLARRPATFHHRLERASVVLSLDCDFLGSEEQAWRDRQAFARTRSVLTPGDQMSRLYVVEALMTQTGMNADHRLRVPASAVLGAGAALAARLMPSNPTVQAVSRRHPPPRDAAAWIEACGQDLAGHRGASLVLAGYRQPLVVHVLAGLLNVALGGMGQTMIIQELADAFDGEPAEALLQALAQGQVETLVLLGGNPAYTTPELLSLRRAGLSPAPSAPTIVRLGAYEDETFGLCDWHLPAAHYLESWGDARTADGTLVGLQPLIEPLYGGLTELEVLTRVTGLDPFKPEEIVRTTFRVMTGPENLEERWKRFLHDGFLRGSARSGPVGALDLAAAERVLATTTAPSHSPDRLELVFFRDAKVHDGRYANNGWLQELPDPVTKLTWDNAVLVSRRTAQALGLRNHQVVEIAARGRPGVAGPIWIQPGMADQTVGVALGYGRTRAGRVGTFNGAPVGFNAYTLRASSSEFLVSDIRLTPTGHSHELACTQTHWSMQGRPIVREATLAAYKADPHLARRTGPPELIGAGGAPASLYPNPLDTAKHSALHQWGMAIDLNLCTGCGACIIACQSENNIPIVGRQQVAKGREMHWMRLDRYYVMPGARKPGWLQAVASDGNQADQPWIDDPRVAVMPMLCQHCEAAPCEYVCPVNATAHDREGLNVMVYNRCVGARYCSNNCPYKVRRFNFFDYSARPLEKLDRGPLASRGADERDLMALARNPDVSVRMRGVMEKCTFCGQRIEQARMAQKMKAGDTSDVVVPEGMPRTACQQACPTGAIVFGNLADPGSRLSKLRQNPRAYSVLEALNTKPRVTYLARIRNPNPAMPGS